MAWSRTSNNYDILVDPNIITKTNPSWFDEAYSRINDKTFPTFGQTESIEGSPQTHTKRAANVT
jgi:hypothetical protein